MLFYLLIAAIFPFVILGYPVIPCGPGVNQVIAARIQGCETSPCHVNQGAIISYEFDFLAGGDSAELYMSVNTTTFGQTIPVPLPPEAANACNGLIGSVCPVTFRQPLTHGGIIRLGTELHGGIPAQLRFLITHEQNLICACAVVNAVIH